jgi:argininosuccinate lyase
VINRDILSNDIYKYLFTVEDVNDAVAAGVPFRDAYREVGMRVQKGTYEHDGRELHHTHEGSIGNLCLDGIAAKFARHKVDSTKALAAEEALMK